MELYSYRMALETRQRLYLDTPLAKGDIVTLNRSQSHYLAQVLRMTLQDEILVFNGYQGEWCARLLDAHKKAVRLTILEQTRAQEVRSELMLVFALIKKTRLETIIEKAVELGAGILQPMMTEYTQIGRINTPRLEAIAIEAAEQTGRTALPQIRQPQTLIKLLDEWPKNRHIIFCDENHADKPTHNMADKIMAMQKKQKLNIEAALFIGPEGGFSPKERATIAQHDATISVSLGKNILRADTAALTALAVWQSVAGEWKGLA